MFFVAVAVAASDVALQERLPAALDRRKRKWWFRRSHVEQYAAARALGRWYATGPGAAA